MATRSSQLLYILALATAAQELTMTASTPASTTNSNCKLGTSETIIVCNGKTADPLLISLSALLNSLSPATPISDISIDDQPPIELAQVLDVLSSHNSTAQHLRSVRIRGSLELRLPDIVFGSKGTSLPQRFSDIRRIDLRANKLPRLPWKLFQAAEWPNSVEVYLGANALLCDCSALWLQKFAQLRQPESVQLVGTRFAYSLASAFLMPNTIGDLNELKCARPERGSKANLASERSIVDADIDCQLPQVRLRPSSIIVLPNEVARFECELVGRPTKAVYLSISLKSASQQGQTIYSTDVRHSVRVQRLSSQKLRLEITNTTVADAGWIVCTAESLAGPALALGALVVHSAPKILTFQQEEASKSSINQLYIELVFYNVESVAQITYTYRNGTRTLENSADDALYNNDDCEDSTLPFMKLARCNDSAVTEKHLFVHKRLAHFRHVRSRADVFSTHTVRVCNAIGCDTASIQIASTYEHPTLPVYPPFEVKIEEHGTMRVEGWLALSALVVLSTVTAVGGFLVYRQRKRKIKVRKSREHTNDIYASLFEADNEEESIALLLRTIQSPSRHDMSEPLESKHSSRLRSLSNQTIGTSLQHSPTRSQSGASGQQFPLLLDADALIWDKQIGEGCFSKVYLAFCTGLPHPTSTSNDALQLEPTPVAVKTVNYDSVRDVRTLLGEAAVLIRLRHPHIVNFYGLAARPDYVKRKEICLVFEYMPCGDLKNYLRQHKPSARRVAVKAESPLARDSVPPRNDSSPNGTDVHLDTTNLLNIILQVSSALSYLAQKKYIHRDLAARNCLVGHNLTIKLSDFGMSRDIYTTDYYRAEGRRLLPVRWLPPEVFQLGTFDTKTDIWSFGVLVWETFSFGQQPWPYCSNEMVINAIIDGEIMHRPEACPEDVYTLAKSCWNREPERRPTAEEVRKEIERIIEARTNDCEQEEASVRGQNTA